MNKELKKQSRTIQGKVISTRMNDTVVIEVINIFRHKLYKKTVKKNKKYLVDKNSFDVQVGDFVEIIENKPISKLKHFKINKKIER